MDDIEKTPFSVSAISLRTKNVFTPVAVSDGEDKTKAKTTTHLNTLSFNLIL